MIRPNDAAMPPRVIRAHSIPTDRAINDIPDLSIETMPKAEATQLIPDRGNTSHAGFGGTARGGTITRFGASLADSADTKKRGGGLYCRAGGQVAPRRVSGQARA
ncbi:hypothetical protein GCM10022255_106330 [Dactylosporangium darangshiense]|uniref:Uncharacterized protein n=1 Tax=Dactylosporangium darangshiense TaxID=579108 RepID=A0ABP8DTF3_9ACTN